MSSYGSSGVYGNRAVEPIPARLYATAGTQIRNGYIVAYRISATETAGVVPGGSESVTGSGETRSDTGSAKEFQVEQPSISNIEHIAGVVCDIGPYSGIVPSVGYLDVQILSFSSTNIAGVEVWTDQSITAGDLLGPQPDSWAARRGALFGNAVLRSIQTVDRSSTAGLVRGTWSPEVTPEEFARKHLIYDNDFYSYVTTGEGLTTIVNTTAGSNALNGVISCSAAATTDNSPGGTKSTQTFVQFQSGAACYFEAKFQATEADTNAANWLIGFQDKAGTTTTTLGDNGAGPVASIDMAAFYKVDGSMFFRHGISRTTAQALVTLTTAFASATEYRVGIFYNGMPITSGGGGRVLFYVNGTLVGTAGNIAAGDELKIPNALMFPTLLVKSGSANGTQTMLVDYMRIRQAKLAAAF